VTHLHQIRACDAVDVGDRDGKEHVAPAFDRLGASVKMPRSVFVRLPDHRRIATQSYLVYRDLRGMELKLNDDYIRSSISNWTAVNTLYRRRVNALTYHPAL
jgi:hypothetical protein